MVTPQAHKAGEGKRNNLLQVVNGDFGGWWKQYRKNPQILQKA